MEVAVYFTKIECQKTCSKWDKETGAGDKSWLGDEWAQSFETPGLPTRQEINNRLDRYDLVFSNFVAHREEPGRFSMARVEDRNGNNNGKLEYWSYYNIKIMVYKTEKVNTPTFGLPEE